MCIRSDCAQPNPSMAVDDLVYMRNRYVYDVVPNAYFIPSKRMLWKLMRACIDVDHPCELWFNLAEPAPKKPEPLVKYTIETPDLDDLMPNNRDLELEASLRKTK